MGSCGWGPPWGPTHFFGPDFSYTGGWVGPTLSIGWSCFALISIRRQRLRVSEGIEVNFVFYHLSSLHFEPRWTLAGVSACVHPLVGLGGGWGQNVTKRYLTYSGNKTPTKKRDDDWDTYSDNEMPMNSETKWARFVYSRIGEWRSASAKGVSFCNSESFSGYCRTLKNIKRLIDGSFLVEWGKRAQAQNLLQTNRFIDRPVKVSIHKTPNSSLGVIRCRDLADMSEVEVRDELKAQGVVRVNRVTLKKVIPTNTLFFDVRFPGTPERDYSRLSKGEGGLVCSQPDAFLQLQQVWPHEPKLQGCCQVSVLWKR